MPDALDVKQVEIGGRLRWAFMVNGRFVAEDFDPTWGLTTYDSPAEALAAGEGYLKNKKAASSPPKAPPSRANTLSLPR